MIAAVLLVVALVSLIGVRFIPRSGRWRDAWLLFCIVNLAAASILGFNSWRKGQRIDDLESQLVAVRDYSADAHLDALGNPPGGGVGSDIKMNTELINLLLDTYSVKGTQIFMKRDALSEERYRTVVEKYPKFPFGHYYLALCLRDRHDEGWRLHARRAVEILQITTQINGHNENHDEVLKKLSSWLEKAEKTAP